MVSSVEWELRVSGSAVTEAWNWQVQGSPPVRLLESVRMLRVSRRARHIPVTAFSMTTGDHVWLESGLEHDLMRRCDRDPSIGWVVSQPFRLSWDEPTAGSHTPDLLTVGVEGEVTVWDARRLDEQDDDFEKHADVARHCCEAVGWSYEVFSGLTTIERMNLLWLHGFRQRPAWTDRYSEAIRCAASGGGATLGHLFDRDDGSGELKSVVWHWVWGGQLAIDLAMSITEESCVTVNERYWDA